MPGSKHCQVCACDSSGVDLKHLGLVHTCSQGHREISDCHSALKETLLDCLQFKLNPLKLHLRIVYVLLLPGRSETY